MFQGGVIPTEAKPGSPANAAVAFDGVGERSGGILCLPAASNTKDSSTRDQESDVLFVAQLVSALRQHSVNALKARRRSLGMMFISWDTASLVLIEWAKAVPSLLLNAPGRTAVAPGWEKYS
jgi:hypothetical protein